MRILFTGASSFTGYWFVRELAAAGHEVHATFTRNGVEQYDPLRAARSTACLQHCTPVWNCSFGDDKFLATLKQGNWDLLCHHGAYVRDYKSLEFDVVAALQANANNLQAVLRQMSASGCGKLLLTGSVFEQGEGMGSLPLRAFSPYGLSKGLTAELFAFWCAHHAIDLAKFVIPNPFGPFEEKRFTAYLIGNWLAGNKPSVNTPDYVRDNIHVSLLAKAYAGYAGAVGAGSHRPRLNPSGYTESQGEFAQRLATEMAPRLGKPCELELAQQEVFDEPRVRINFDKAWFDDVEWDENEAWDRMAEYYLASQDK